MNLKKLSAAGQEFLLRWSAKLQLPGLTAYLLVRNTRPVNFSNSEEESSLPKVLCLGRSIFMLDIQEMALVSGKLHYLELRFSQLSVIYDAFIKNTYESHQYYQTPEDAPDKIALYKFLKKLLPKLKERLGFSAIVSGNFTYNLQQELTRVAKEQNVPFFILYKEGMVIKEWMDDWVKAYKACKFIGTQVLCYNEPIRQALVRKEVPGISDSNSTVVGVPRFDRYFRERIPPRKAKQYVLFSYLPTEKFGFVNPDPELLERLCERSDRFHIEFCKFALSHPDHTLIVKTKVGKRYPDYVRELMHENLERWPENLTVTNAGSPLELIKDSSLVFGCNSTTLLEAAVMGRRVIVPDQNDLFSGASWDLFGESCGVADYYSVDEDFEQFVMNLEEAERDGVKRESMDSFLNDYIGPPDGCASIRAEQEILNVLEAGR